VTGQSEVKSAVSNRIQYRRREGFGKVSKRAVAGDDGNLASLLPSRVNPERFLDLVTPALKSWLQLGSIA